MAHSANKQDKSDQQVFQHSGNFSSPLNTVSASSVSAEHNEMAKIEIELNDVACDRGNLTHLRLYIDGAEVSRTAPSDVTAMSSRLVDMDENASAVIEKTADSVLAFLNNKGDKRITKLLVQPQNQNELTISAIVVEDRKDGTATRIAIQDAVVNQSQLINLLVIAPSQYSLLRHVADYCGGYLRPDFYENSTEHGYGLTMRSLVRHALNNMEAYLGQNRVQVDSTVNGTFATNMSMADSKKSFGTMLGEGNWAAAAKRSWIAQCETEERGNNTSNGRSCQQVRRQLGIDTSLSKEESSAVVGVAAVGIALSVLMNRRRPLALPRMSQRSMSNGLQVNSSDSLKKIYSSVTKSIKNLL